MFISPVTGFKLKHAHAKGGTLWYCSHSNGRLITLVMAKHFLGNDAAREVWVRSGLSTVLSSHECPSCTKPMRMVSTPQWTECGEVEVCRRCHLIWLGGKQASAVPLPGDLITAKGDSTLVRDVGHEVAKLAIARDEKRAAADSLVHLEEPESLLQQLPAYLGLPVEITDRKPEWVWGTGLIAVVCVITHWILTRESSLIIENWGFYPNDPLKHFGLNAFSSVLLHGGWLHLLGNLYFFCVFADDVEESLGFKKYFLFLASTSAFLALSLSLWSGSPGLPHVGLSGVIMAVLTFYVLQFPKTKIAFLLPGIHRFVPEKGMVSFISAWRWTQLPVWLVVGFYVLKDVVFYFAIEKSRLGNVSYSAHVSGALFGAAYWWLVARSPRKSSKELTGAIDRAS